MLLQAATATAPTCIFETACAASTAFSPRVLGETEPSPLSVLILVLLLSGPPAPPSLSYAIHEALFQRGDRLLRSVQQLFTVNFRPFDHPVNMARLHGFCIGQQN